MIHRSRSDQHGDPSRLTGVFQNLAPLLQALEQAGIAEADIAGHLADLIRAKAETAQSAPKAAKKHYLEQTH